MKNKNKKLAIILGCSLIGILLLVLIYYIFIDKDRQLKDNDKNSSSDIIASSTSKRFVVHDYVYAYNNYNFENNLYSGDLLLIGGKIELVSESNDEQLQQFIANFNYNKIQGKIISIYFDENTQRLLLLTNKNIAYVVNNSRNEITYSKIDSQKDITNIGLAYANLACESETLFLIEIDGEGYILYKDLTYKKISEDLETKSYISIPEACNPDFAYTLGVDDNGNIGLNTTESFENNTLKYLYDNNQKISADEIYFLNDEKGNYASTYIISKNKLYIIDQKKEDLKNNNYQLLPYDDQIEFEIFSTMSKIKLSNGKKITLIYDNDIIRNEFKYHDYGEYVVDYESIKNIVTPFKNYKFKKTTEGDITKIVDGKLIIKDIDNDYADAVYKEYDSSKITEKIISVEEIYDHDETVALYLLTEENNLWAISDMDDKLSYTLIDQDYGKITNIGTYGLCECGCWNNLLLQIDNKLYEMHDDEINKYSIVPFVEKKSSSSFCKLSEGIYSYNLFDCTEFSLPINYFSEQLEAEVIIVSHNYRISQGNYYIIDKDNNFYIVPTNTEFDKEKETLKIEGKVKEYKILDEKQNYDDDFIITIKLTNGMFYRFTKDSVEAMN